MNIKSIETTEDVADYLESNPGLEPEHAAQILKGAPIMWDLCGDATSELFAFYLYGELNVPPQWNEILTCITECNDEQLGRLIREHCEAAILGKVLEIQEDISNGY